MNRVGVIGGGQLARMMIPAAINLGLDLRVFAEASDASAGLALDRVGDYNNFGELLGFAKSVDVVTFDHEHVPIGHLQKLREFGVSVFPPPEALALTHSKIEMRKALDLLDIPQPMWAVLENQQDPGPVLNTVKGFPCIAKLPSGGYDGKGVRVINSLDEIEDWISQGPVLLEEEVSFSRELAQVGARTPGGEWASWQVVETRQVGGVCSSVVAPAQSLLKGQTSDASRIAEVIAREFNVVGVMAVELFESVDGRLLVNELAMRPHNSGHIFTELSRTGQFEQHLRAVSGYPLGSTEFVSEVGIMVNIFGRVPLEGAKQALRAHPEIKLHSYGKAPRPGRKAGHLSLVGSDYDQVRAVTTHSQNMLDSFD
jgi:5-(carboxyamino)imidazole ribonucleotide synthase